MKSLAAMNAAVSLLYVVYPNHAREQKAADVSPFYVWGKHSLSFCKRPLRSSDRGH